MIILYADDDPDDQDIFTEVIKEIDPEISVVYASDGLEVLTYLSESASRLPDFIFLDVNMPLLGGYATLIEIRKDPRFNNTHVILYSTGIHPKEQEMYKHLSVRFVKKRNTLNETIECLRNIVKNV